MPKTSRMRKNCRIEVEWLEPESDKGRRSTILAKKIISFEKGLQIEQNVLCSWGSRKYKAVVKAIEARVSEPECTDQPILPDSVEETQPPRPDEVSSTALPSFPEIQVNPSSTAIATQTDDETIPCFTLSAGTQTECIFVTHESMSTMQQQLENLTENNAALTAQIKSIMDFIGRAQVPTSPSCASLLTPPRSSPLRKEQPRYGKIVDGIVRVQVDAGSVPFVEISKVKYDKSFYDAKTATSFARQLLRLIVSNEEITTSNFEGGQVLTAKGVIVKPMLERARMSALLSQVELEFPGSTLGKTSICKLREAINECCRKEARKRLDL